MLVSHCIFQGTDPAGYDFHLNVPNGATIGRPFRVISCVLSTAPAQSDAVSGEFTSVGCVEVSDVYFDDNDSCFAFPFPTASGNPPSTCVKIEGTVLNRSGRIKSSDLCIEIRFVVFADLALPVDGSETCGGAVFANVTSNITIYGCRFMHCDAIANAGEGGGCWISAPSSVSISNSFAQTCYASRGQFVFYGHGCVGMNLCNTTSLDSCGPNPGLAALAGCIYADGVSTILERLNFTRCQIREHGSVIFADSAHVLASFSARYLWVSDCQGRSMLDRWRGSDEPIIECSIFISNRIPGSWATEDNSGVLRADDYGMFVSHCIFQGDPRLHRDFHLHLGNSEIKRPYQVRYCVLSTSPIPADAVNADSAWIGIINISDVYFGDNDSCFSFTFPSASCSSSRRFLFTRSVSFRTGASSTFTSLVISDLALSQDVGAESASGLMSTGAVAGIVVVGIIVIAAAVVVVVVVLPRLKQDEYETEYVTESDGELPPQAPMHDAFETLTRDTMMDEPDDIGNDPLPFKASE
jgi:hypothetical protein